MEVMKRFRVRRAGGQRNPHHVLTVPAEIVRLLASDQEFIVEITDAGILYRAVDPSEPPPDQTLPEWMKRGAQNDSTS